MELHPQIMKLFNNKKCILSGQIMNSLFPIYNVIMINSVLVIKVKNTRCMYTIGII